MDSVRFAATMRTAAAMLLALASAWQTCAEELQSPRLQQLATELEAGDPQAVDAFWDETAAQTSPLIELIPGDPDNVLLTVLWRGDSDTENVLLVGGLAAGHPLDNTLTRLRDTDIWFRTILTGTDLRASYQFSPNDPLEMVPMDDEAAVRKQRENYQNDPLNPKRWGGGSLVELPDAPPQPWIERNPDAPRGGVKPVNAFASAILGNKRRVAVYTPASYDSHADAYPLLLIFDYESYSTLVPTPRILDNLIYAQKIPPIVCVLVGNAPNARNSELPCNDRFLQFLTDELLPFVHEHYNVTNDPARNIVAGSSFGGLAASFIALRRPDLFGNVISQSGSYWWSPETNTAYLEPGVKGEWLTEQFASTEKKPVRFFIESGLLEGGDPSMVEVNRNFRDALLAKGYEIVRYDKYNGGHEYLNWRGSLAEALIALTN